MSVFIIAVIYLGVLVTKYNFQIGFAEITHFRLRYTFILLFIVGYTVYVDTLPEREKEIKIVQVKNLFSAAYYHLHDVAVDSYDWVRSAGINLTNRGD